MIEISSKSFFLLHLGSLEAFPTTFTSVAL